MHRSSVANMGCCKTSRMPSPSRSFPSLSSCFEVRVRHSLVFLFGLLLRNHGRGIADLSSLEYIWNAIFVQNNSCTAEERVRRSPPLALERCTLPQELARDHCRRWTSVFHDKSGRRSLQLAFERCTSPQELTRLNLQELEKCIPRQGLARHSMSLEMYSTTRAVAAYTAGP